jgi:ElaB/YqjD/DUF883 family membrane-anchored ribosome-binding protein
MVEKSADKDTAETLREDINRLHADIAAITKSLKDLGAETGSEAYERVRRSAQRAKGEAEKAATAVGHQIEEKPLTSVLLAFVVGAILGALISRR